MPVCTWRCVGFEVFPVPRAYQLLVGVSGIDTDSGFYREHFPGYDGRRGCEGTARDIERMHGLTHYLGYEPLTPKPLMDARATRAGVLAALSTLGTPGFLQPNDIVLLYFTCHGRSVGEGKLKNPSRFIGNRINYVMLHDRPLFNFELIERLLRIPPKVRVFTMVDACHAGLGSNLEVDRSSFLLEAKQHVVETLQSRATKDAVFRSRYVRAMDSSEVVILERGSAAPNPTPASFTFLEFYQRLLTLYSGHPEWVHQVAHFGAARDEAKARGGPEGSLFTRLFYDLLVESGHSYTYHRFFNELRERVPLLHPPVAEYLGKNSKPAGQVEALDDEMIPPSEGHFAAREHVLEI
jgi:hypothetical protein